MAATDAIDEFIALPRDQQLSTLQKLPQDKQDKLLGQIKQRKFAANAPTIGPNTGPTTFDQRVNALTQMKPVNAKQSIGENVTNFVGDIGAGGLGLLLHPVKAAEDTAASFVPAPLLQWNNARRRAAGQPVSDRDEELANAPNPIQAMYQGLNTAPAETIASGIGQGAVTGGVESAVGRVAEVAPPAFRSGLRKLAETATGTGSKTTADLVRKTQAENATAATKHGEDLQQHQADVRNVRKSNVDALNDHLAKIDEVSGVKQDAKSVSTLRKQLPKIIDDTAEDVDVRIEKARHDALAEGNKKYNAVNPELNPIEADQEAIGDARLTAAEAIKGSETKVPILEDMTKHTAKGDTFNYEDLQGYYSELGREISKGTLPGDVYHALDTLHESIGDEMQRIADSQGKGAELKAAREYWRRMKQTFGDTSDTVSDRAGKELSATHPDLPKAQMSDYRRRLLGSFDPQIPRMLDSIDQGKSRLEGLPKEKEVPAYPAPPDPKKLPPTPEFNPKKLSTEDIRGAKEEKVRKAAGYLHNRALAFGAYVTGFKSMAAVSRALMGDVSALGALPTDVGEGVGTMLGTHAIASFLESPKVLKLLGSPTARDLAEIPPEMRGDLKPIVEQAQKQGIKVDPKLAALVGATLAPKHPTLSRPQ